MESYRWLPPTANPPPGSAVTVPVEWLPSPHAIEAVKSAAVEPAFASLKTATVFVKVVFLATVKGSGVATSGASATVAVPLIVTAPSRSWTTTMSG